MSALDRLYQQTEQALQTKRAKQALTRVKKVREGHENVVHRVRSGNLQDLQAVLVEQFFVMDERFTSLMALLGVAKEPAQVRAYTNAALKCQSACMKTVQAIHEMQNPRRQAVFVKQLNQLVQGVKSGQKGLDGRTAQIAGGADTPMEALGEFDRAEDRAREAEVVS